MDGGAKCLALYTNPNFFLDEWISEQLKLRANAKEERKKRREERRLQKEKNPKQVGLSAKKPMQLHTYTFDPNTGEKIFLSRNQSSGGGLSAAESTLKKSKSSMGESGYFEAPPPVPSSNSDLSVPTDDFAPPPIPRQDTDSSTTSDYSAQQSQQAQQQELIQQQLLYQQQQQEYQMKQMQYEQEQRRFQKQQHAYELQQQQYQQEQLDPAPPPPPGMDLPAFIPPPSPGMQSYFPPPSPANIGPMSRTVSIPPPAPTPPTPPVAPVPPPMPDWNSGGSSSGGGLLGEISNKQLRRVEQAAKPVDSRSNLLTSIKSGIQLKSAHERKIGEQPSKKEEGPNSVAAILSRRIAIQESDSDDDADSDNEAW